MRPKLLSSEIPEKRKGGGNFDLFEELFAPYTAAEYDS
jgi:hypothetical protein